jgi:hypothetical protein
LHDCSAQASPASICVWRYFIFKAGSKVVEPEVEASN